MYYTYVVIISIIIIIIIVIVIIIIIIIINTNITYRSQHSIVYIAARRSLTMWWCCPRGLRDQSKAAVTHSTGSTNSWDWPRMFYLFTDTAVKHLL